MFTQRRHSTPTIQTSRPISKPVAIGTPRGSMNFSLSGAYSLYSDPVHYLVFLESPVRADLEGGNPALTDHFINRGMVDFQQLADVLYRQNFAALGGPF
jgi:hypothetical protein